MRYLGVGDSNELGDMYLRLSKAGHDVRVFAERPEDRDILRGMVELVADWRAQLGWVREAGNQGYVVFETARHGEAQDELRRDGYQVIGGSAAGDRLEEDRSFGQEVLARAGLSTAAVHSFDDFSRATAFVRETRGRYVLKLNGASAAWSRNYVGEADDGEDMLSMLSLQAHRWPEGEKPSFVLMQHLRGVEVGVGAYFDGERFLGPACLDFEHKRFFPGDLGEQTGEMGTVATYRRSQRLFDLTLGKLTDTFRASNYRGYVNLNTIANDQGVWPLEFTCRFGYPGFAVLGCLQAEPWEAVLEKLAKGSATSLDTHDGFAVAVVLTVPPFPYPHGYAELGKGEPVGFARQTTPADLDHFHFGEVERLGGHLVTSGSIGYVMVVTGRGSTVELAQRDAYGRVAKVVIPNVRYRNDIGDRVIARDLAELERLGLLD